MEKWILHKGKCILKVYKRILHWGKWTLLWGKRILHMEKCILEVYKRILREGKCILHWGKRILHMGKCILRLGKHILEVYKRILREGKWTLLWGKRLLHEGKSILKVENAYLSAPNAGLLVRKQAESKKTSLESLFGRSWHRSQRFLHRLIDGHTRILEANIY